MCGDDRASMPVIHHICNRRLYAKIWWNWVGVLHIYPCQWWIGYAR